MNETTYPNTYKFLDDQGLKVVKAIKQELQRGGKVATGTLLNSVDYDIVDTNYGVKLEIEYAKYGQFVLSGRRPGAKMVPILALLKWIKAKKGLMSRVKGSNYKEKQENAKSLAWAMAKSIQQKGIKKFNFLKPYDNLQRSKAFIAGLSSALAKDTAKALNATVK